jgi:hypothetical protein
MQCLLNCSFLTGRERNQEALLFELLVKSFLHTWLRTGRHRTQKAFLFEILVQSFFNISSPFFTLRLELVDKEIKRPFSLIILCSPFLIVHLHLVEKELKRVILWFSCEVFSSYLVYNWSTKKSRGLPL